MTVSILFVHLSYLFAKLTKITAESVHVVCGGEVPIDYFFYMSYYKSVQMINFIVFFQLKHYENMYVSYIILLET